MSEDELRREIERLNGELFALRALLFYFLRQLQPHAPGVIRAAFDAAADHAEAMALRFGADASPLHVAKALEIIEDFRARIVPPSAGLA